MLTFHRFGYSELLLDLYEIVEYLDAAIIVTTTITKML